MSLLMLSFATSPVAEALPAGLTLPLLAVLPWFLAVRLVKLGMLPGGMAGLESLARDLAQSGRLRTFGACMILMLVSGSKLHLGMPSCVQSSCFLRPHVCMASLQAWGIRSWMPQAPSSWKLPGLELLARAGGTECVHLDQCCCATPWKKPTRLLAVGIPELGRLVAKLPGGGRCCPALGHGYVTLSGKGDDGVYRNAPAKTYNSVMCKVLADATFGSINVSFVVMSVSWQLNVVSRQRSLCCMFPLTTTTLSRGLLGRMIVPGHPLESCRLPIRLALSGTWYRTGCALPSPSPSPLSPRPIRRPQRAWKRSEMKYLSLSLSIYIYIYTYIYRERERGI